MKRYEGGDVRKSALQIAATFIPYSLLLTAMFLLHLRHYPYGLVLALALVASMFHVRIFMLLHDCAHNSFFNSPRACAVFGHICGFVTSTPFFNWQRSHGIHHATVSNLDRRGTGDVWTMTVDEYRAADRMKRFRYRLLRNPFVLFGVAPVLLFHVIYRFPGRGMKRRELVSILLTDLAIAAILAAFAATTGLAAYLAVMAPVLYLAGIMGFWLFYIQHQFTRVYWAHDSDWDIHRASMRGSSFYDLPAPLRWLSANIGYHHIHHLKPRIPSYNLRACYEGIPEVRDIVPITLRRSFESLRLRLWDEGTGRLVGFAEA
ncbi:MAG: fatty acid desaturase [Spirochaetes bacterium]|nr:fatty acid desaturase [Spirochaetota bacterium]